MNKKVVFFDVDGTLIDCVGGMNYVLDSSKEIIQEIKRRGHSIILATGRPKCYLNEEILNLGFDAYITSNGAYIELDGKEIYNKKIKEYDLKESISFLRDKKIEFILEGQEYSYVSNLECKPIKNLLKLLSVKPSRIINELNFKKINANKIVVFIQDEKKIDECKEKFKQDFEFMELEGLDAYDVYFKDCSKADGAKMVIKDLQINIEDTFAFGDGINDIEIFNLVKYGIAMGNANEKLKEIAYYVTDDVFSHGIYNGVKKLQII